MLTNLLGVNVPDYPYEGQEICHLFTGNWVIHHDQQGNRYRLLHENENSYDFIIEVLEHYGKNMQDDELILPGDIILIDHHNHYIGHSMVAINEHVWFGVNNSTTFGKIFEVSGIPFDTLPLRREIDFLELNDGAINYETKTINKFDGSQLQYEIWR